MKRLFIVSLFIGILLGVVINVKAPLTASAHSEHQTVCFCHNLEHNPHTICTNNQGLINGHMAHVQSGFDSLGECVVPTPTPAEITPTLTPTPTEEPCVVFEKEFPVPCPTEEPSITPTPSQTQGEGNVPSNPHTDTTEAPASATCNVPFEVARTWYDKNELHWATDAQGIEKFSIVYGPDRDHMIYGIDNITSTARAIAKPQSDFKQTWFSVYTWKDGCSNMSEPLDP